MIMDDDLDQDAMAAEWGAALGDDDGEDGEDRAEMDEDVAAQWAAMIDDSGEGEDSSSGGGERVLNQDEIDSLLGFDLDEQSLTDASGIRAIINSAMVSYERLPMLEIVFDRLVRLLTTSLRNFTSDNVEVSLDNISTMRFGDYLNSIPLPAMISVFKAVEWDNYALLTVDSTLIYSIVDVLLGGRGTPAIRIEGRPYTTIETNLMKRLIEVILEDAESAFEPLSPVKFEVERLETNPRFAAIARQANAAILIKLRIDMEDRGGRIEIMIPYATLEPIRELLLQGFMGEKFGRDTIWESHLATEIYQTAVPVEAVLDQMTLPLRKVMNLQVGETVALNCKPEDPVQLRCGDIALTTGTIGRVGEHVSVRVTRGIDKSAAPYRAPYGQKRGGGSIAMSGQSLGFIVEALVAILLVVTIGYCVLVNRKLDRIRSDKSDLRAIIRDLYAATTHAEKAIGTLRDTASELEENLGTQISLAKKTEERIIKNTARGEALLSKLTVVARNGAGDGGARRPVREQEGEGDDGLMTATPSRGRASGIRHSEMGLGLLNAQQRRSTTPAAGRKEVA